ncbi:MAG: hypothetical protein AAGE80_08175 [Pseudomonadota bacterium]
MDIHIDPAILFRMEIYKSHVELVRRSQERRFEILRYSFAGLATYYAFLMTLRAPSVVCTHTAITLVWIPIFFLTMVFLYISIVNRNIAKHGQFLKYLFDNAMNKHGLGPNLYNDFINAYEPSTIERLLERGRLHYTQLVVLAMIGGVIALFLALGVDPSDPICQPKGTS